MFPDIKTPAINHIGFIPNAASRSLFDEMAGINSSDLTNAEIEALRPDVYEALSKEATKPIYLKTHDMFRMVAKQQPLISKKATNSILYMVRNPLDIAVSYAKFKNVHIDQAIAEMGSASNSLASSDSNALKVQVPQLLSTWSNHVLSWTGQTEVPIKVVRYEDLLNDPFHSFLSITEFFEIPHTKKEVELAIEKSRFKRLVADEKLYGFKDKFASTANFFRKGISGEGELTLSQPQINAIRDEQFEAMKMFDYMPG
jgi:hypothetical protein